MYSTNNKVFNLNIEYLLMLKSTCYNLNTAHFLKKKFLKGKLNYNYLTFGDEKSNNLLNKISLIKIFVNSKCFLKHLNFYYVKKKILKSVNFEKKLSKSFFINFLFYLKYFYFYFWSIYFHKKIPEFFDKVGLNFFFDNPQFFFKDFLRLRQKINFSLSIIPDNNIPVKVFKLLMVQFSITKKF